MKTYKKQSYFRLLSYAKPYKMRIAIGVIAGLMVAGSLFSAFMFLPNVLALIDSNANSQVIENENQSKENLVEAKEATGIKIVKELAKEYNIEIEDEKGRMTLSFVLLGASGLMILILIRGIGIYLNRYYMRWVGARVVSDLRDEVFDKLLGQSLKFFGKNDTGHLISRCTNDTASIEAAVASVIADAARCPAEILACVSAIVYTCIEHNDFSLAIVLFVCMPLIFVPILILGRIIRKIYTKAFDKIASVVSRMHEVFTCILAVKAAHMEKDEKDRFKIENRKYFRTVVKGLKLELCMNPIVEIAGGFVVIGFIVYSYTQNVTLTQIIALLAPAVIAYKPVKQLSKIATYIQRSMAAADRYFDLLDTEKDVLEKENPIALSEFNNEIEFKNVEFSYTEDKNILDGVSFKIPKGNLVAVVGETGSGKTTIANLIARFYDVNSGELLIDGNNVKDLEIASFRDLIGIVSQDTLLFNESIKYNIGYGAKNVTDEQIENAAKQANAHKFIISGAHEEGYDTVVGEKGFKLSGGEKQRVAIARAILKNPPILILDEATSALDTVTENLVQEALNRVMENRTVFAIAHRLSTIQHADTIIVLDKGKLVESGTHKELLEQGGRYKKLYDTQFKDKKE